jgi:hypothetical protein
MTSTVSWHESPPPTSATPRTDRSTYGGDVAETARMLGTPFMGWQSLVADRAMEHEDGRLVYREVDLSIDRQAGKSTLVLAVAVRRMLSAPNRWLTYTSASAAGGSPEAVEGVVAADPSVAAAGHVLGVEGHR